MLSDDREMEGEYEGASVHYWRVAAQSEVAGGALPTATSRTTVAMDGSSREWEGQCWERGEGMENVGECPGAVYIDGGGREGSDRRGKWQVRALHIGGRGRLPARAGFPYEQSNEHTVGYCFWHLLFGFGSQSVQKICSLVYTLQILYRT
jgi:hypothetical protein